MSFKLTFNKPAADLMGEADALRIKIENGAAMFQPAFFSEGGDDLVMLQSRGLRGGLKAYINGSEADELLKAINHNQGPFSLLEWHNVKGSVNEWLVTTPFTDEGDPPKFKAHLRIWADENAPQKEVERVERAPKVAARNSPDLGEMDYLERVRWAYNRLSQPRGPGRPDKDTLAAQKVKAQFEQACAHILPGGALDVEAMVKAHEIIGYFLNTRVPGSADFNNKALAAAAISSLETAEANLAKLSSTAKRKTRTSGAHAHH